MKQQDQPNSSDKLLVLRGLACLMVFFSHIYPPDLPLIWAGLDWRFALFQDGVSAVRIFFILSGYLIAKNFFNGKYTFNWVGILKFYQGRIRRIVPLYYFISLVLLMVSYRVLFTTPDGLIKILSIFTFTFDIDQRPYFTGAWWSLSTEIQFYLLAPLILGLILRLRHKSWIKLGFYLSGILGGFLLLRFASARGYLTINPDQMRVLLINLDLFLAGAFLNLIVPRLNRWQTQLQRLVWLFYPSFLCVNLFLALNLYSKIHLGRDLVNSGVVLPTLTIFAAVFWIILAEANPARQLDIRWRSIPFRPVHTLEIMGILSYGFYLWHGDVLWNIRHTVGNATWPQYFGTVFLAFSATLILTVTTYYLIERDFFKISPRARHTLKFLLR